MTMFPSGGFVSPSWRPNSSAASVNDSQVAVPGTIESSAASQGNNENIIDLLKKRADDGDAASLDYLISYLLSEQSLASAREWTAKREDSQYQRMVRDLKASGINPYFALTGGSPVSSSTQGVNYQGSSYTSASNNKRTTSTSQGNNIRNNIFDLFGDILRFISSNMSSAAGLISGVAKN